MTDLDTPCNHLEQYQQFGFVGPLKAFDENDLRDITPALLKEMQTRKGLLARRNRHLDSEITHKLTHAPAMLALAKELLGPELILWRTNFFLGDPSWVPWHQDEYRTLLADAATQLSLHLGLTEATADNCVMIVPGSHLMNREALGKIGFHFIKGTDKGAYGAPNYWREDNSSPEVIRMILKPGEFFAFHPSLIHASIDRTQPPGPAYQEMLQSMPRPKSPRLGLALRITVPHNKVLESAFAETKKRGDYTVPLP